MKHEIQILKKTLEEIESIVEGRTTGDAATKKLTLLKKFNYFHDRVMIFHNKLLNEK